ncbi:MAG: hypothetical protein DWQ01_11455 [Planctomycetota bacterium]|nr:MAG: hypothetical protein DWQ01_11455 [Planctomycetota bacterium]
MRTLRPGLVPLLLLLFSGFCLAQAPEDPGPFPAGWRDVGFQDQQFGRGWVTGRVFYPATVAGENVPADPTSGPFPLVAFQHGWLGSPDSYDLLCQHLASWGFVVASIGTETGLFGTMKREALDSQALLHWTDGESQNPASWLAGMCWDGDWAASGHSMGGGALMYLVGYEPRVRTFVALQPYSGTSLGGSAEGYQNLRQFTGRAYYIAGEIDGTVPPDTMVYDYFQNAYVAERNLFYMVEGMGHLGPIDDPPDNEPLPGPEQHRLHRRLLAGLLRAEMKGEEDLFAVMLGEGVSQEPLVYQSDCEQPPLWLEVESNGDLQVGLAGAGDDTLMLAWSLIADQQQTQYGLLGLDLSGGAVFLQTPAGKTRVADASLMVQAGWAGQWLYLQGLAVGPQRGQLSRTIAYSVP